MINSLADEAIIRNCFVAPNLGAAPARRSGGHAKTRQYISGRRKIQSKEDNQENQIHNYKSYTRDIVCLCLQLHRLPFCRLLLT
jgi:hypothetical protein